MERFIKDNISSILTLESMTNNVLLYSDLLRPERLFNASLDEQHKPMSIEMAEKALKEFDDYLCVMVTGIENMRDEFINLEAVVRAERAKLDEEQAAVAMQDQSTAIMPANAQVNKSANAIRF